MAGTPNAKKQHREFVKAARELGCDEDEAAFKERLKRLVSAPSAKVKSVQKRKVKKRSP